MSVNSSTALVKLSDDKKRFSFITLSKQEEYETGSLLIDLLEMEYLSFIYKYPILCATLKIDPSEDEINSIDIGSIMSGENYYKCIQSAFRNIVHICFDTEIDEYSYINQGSPMQRYAFYTLKIDPEFEKYIDPDIRMMSTCFPYKNKMPVYTNYSQIANSTLEDAAKAILNSDISFDDFFYFQSLSDLIYFEMVNALKGYITIKKCENCKRYFIPIGRNDALYCNRIAPNSKKTCLEIGAIKKYQSEIDKNPILKAYRKEYKKRYERVRKTNSLKNDFFEWAEEAKRKRDSAIKNEITLEEFTTWLKQ